MQNTIKAGLVWLRRDLRWQDNPALQFALACCAQVHCVFLFDTDILQPLPANDRRVAFIHASVEALDATLREQACMSRAGLIVLHGTARTEIPRLARLLQVQCVFAAHDYEPLARQRDEQVHVALAAQGVRLETVKDHVIWERRELLTQGGKPYGVFTPYLRAWLARTQAAPQTPRSPNQMLQLLAPRPDPYDTPVPSLTQLGFGAARPMSGIMTGSSGAQRMFDDFWERMDDYEQRRNYPAVKGPSYLGVHLRFGTISIRQLVAIALRRMLEGSTGATVWLSELVWRDFYFQILANFPHVAGGAFKPEYDRLQWEQGARANDHFIAWCEGRTGYPLVDAAMAQLNQTGYMHNRLRMVAGSFLVKHLGIDWRWGERYFAEKLNDFDLSANNGGWQWVSSCGCDAQPYFRIFNPVTQSQKFDAQGKFILRYLPQLRGLNAKHLHAPWQAKPVDLSAAGVVLGHDYPFPIVDHAQARAKTLLRYAVVNKSVQASAGVLQ